MNTEVLDHVSVATKLTGYGLRAPIGLAILPANLAAAKTMNEFRQHVESDTVRTLLNANNIPYDEIFDDEDQPAYLQQYGFEWFGPTLFIAAGVLSQESNVLSITLGIITNYLYDLFKGSTDAKANLNVIFQQADGTCKEIRYSGPHQGLSEIAAIVSSLDQAK